MVQSSGHTKGQGVLQHRLLHAAIERLLTDGEGLTLGPDSDGLLNFCDMPTPAQAPVQLAQAGPSEPSSSAAAHKGKGKAPAEVPNEVLLLDNYSVRQA